MPIIFGTLITAVTYNSPVGLVVDGEAFADTEYPGVSKVEISLTGAGVWSAAPVIVSWSDTQVQATLGSTPSPGTYDVRITSSDGEQNIFSNAFTVIPITPSSFSPTPQRIWIGCGIGV